MTDLIADPIARLVDHEHGTVSRTIFSDPEIYRQELDRIFTRCWLYLAHESQIPSAGDFALVTMGEEQVLVCRDTDGAIYASINSCRHRGNRVCRADVGNAKSFECPYHGWTYNVRGDLIGVPGARDLYHGDLDRSKLGLVRVAQVDTYRGLIFGTFDPEAPPLSEYLGDIRFGLDLLLDQGEMVAVPGILRWEMNVNWKFAADNSIGDMYHGFWTHRSAMLAGHAAGNLQSRGVPAPPALGDGFTMVTAYGHGFTANFIDPENVRQNDLSYWRFDPDVKARLGEFRSKVNRANMLIFPNLFVNTGSRDLMVRNPMGPGKMEICKTVLVDRNATEAQRRAAVRASNRHFGPAGMFEQDDGENWDQSTAAARGPVAKRYDLQYNMGLGHGVLVEDGRTPPRVDTLTNEHAQLWMYRVWAEFMSAPGWDALRARHLEPRGTL